MHTAGLNNPPDTLKNTHTFTAKLNPKLKAMNINTLTFGTCVILAPWAVVLGFSPTAAVLATWVPPKAKKRNMKVPQNSARAAMSSLRHRGEMECLE